jgi:hypothetical protein
MKEALQRTGVYLEESSIDFLYLWGLRYVKPTNSSRLY